MFHCSSDSSNNVQERIVQIFKWCIIDGKFIKILKDLNSEQFVFRNCTNSSGIHLTKVIDICFSLWLSRFHKCACRCMFAVRGISVEPLLYSHSVRRSPFLQIKKFTDLSQWVIIMIIFLWMVNTLYRLYKTGLSVWQNECILHVTCSYN